MSDFDWVFIGRHLRDDDADVLEALYSESDNVLVLQCDATEAPHFMAYLLRDAKVIGGADV